jgi:hypothetical protein
MGRVDPNQFKIPTADTSGSLRLTRTVDFVSAYYWAGSSWQVIHSSPDFSEPLSLLLVGVQIGGPEVVGAVFDDFRLEYDPIPEPASLLLLSIGLAALARLRKAR